MVRIKELESPTYGLEVRRSIHLSYTRKFSGNSWMIRTSINDFGDRRTTIVLKSYGGRGRIRTFEGRAGGFTVRCI